MAPSSSSPFPTIGCSTARQLVQGARLAAAAVLSPNSFPAGASNGWPIQPMHVDPEFETFTSRRSELRRREGLRHPTKNDLLIFYAGLEGFDFESAPALYIIGYFELELAGLATSFSTAEIAKHFANNFHVHHRSLFAQQKNELVLVKGSKRSRLLKKARLLSETLTLNGKPPVKKISFGDAPDLRRLLPVATRSSAAPRAGSIPILSSEPLDLCDPLAS